MSLFRLVYGKVHHLPVELEYKLLWIIKNINFDLEKANENKKLQLNELEKIRTDECENVKIYQKKQIFFMTNQSKEKRFFQTKRLFCMTFDFIYSRYIKIKMDWTIRDTCCFSTRCHRNRNPRDGSIFKVNGHHLKSYLKFASDQEQELMIIHKPHYVQQEILTLL